jgi:hypothetical protein
MLPSPGDVAGFSGGDYVYAHVGWLNPYQIIRVSCFGPSGEERFSPLFEKQTKNKQTVWKKML